MNQSFEHMGIVFVKNLFFSFSVKLSDAGASGSQLINYQPYNSLDLSEIMDPDSALVDIVDQQNGNYPPFSLRQTYGPINRKINASVRRLKLHLMVQ